MVDMTALTRIARRQQSFVTLEQIREAGGSQDLADARVRARQWRRPRRGVYELGAPALSWERSVLCAVLSVGPPVWASHRTAARIHALDVPPPDRIDLLTRPDRRLRLAGVVHHRSNTVPRRDVAVRSRIPVTRPARTLVDCVPHIAADRLARVVDDAVRRGLLVLDDLVACVARLDGPGRRLVAPLRPVLADLLEGCDPGGSSRERELVAELARSGLPLPVQQHEVSVHGRRYQLDAAWPWAKVGVEFDGFAEHSLRTTFDRDRTRSNDLVAAGWVLLHATSNTSVSELVDRCRDVLQARAA